MSVQKLNFTLENITYNAVVKGNDDIEVVLPRKEPSVIEYNDKFTKNKSVVIQPAVQVVIKVFLTVKKKCTPKLNVHGEDNKAMINFANVPKSLPADSRLLLTFSTIDGGNTWLVQYQRFVVDPTSGDLVDAPGVSSINGVPNVSGDVTLDASDIKMSKTNPNSPTIIEQVEATQQEIVVLKTTVTNEVTKEVVQVLPDAIKTVVNDEVEIIAEKV